MSTPTWKERLDELLGPIPTQKMMSFAEVEAELFLTLPNHYIRSKNCEVVEECGDERHKYSFIAVDKQTQRESVIISYTYNMDDRTAFWGISVAGNGFGINLSTDGLTLKGALYNYNSWCKSLILPYRGEKDDGADTVQHH
jgi:hypothetical protein